MSKLFENMEFTDNPEPRCPCVLVLDTSGSMTGDPIQQLNEGLQVFKAAINEDRLARLRVEVAIITLGPVTLLQDFVTVDNFTPPQLDANGDTPLGGAINLALDICQERKKTYKTNGIRYYQPWIFTITDGAPTDDTIWPAAAKRVHEAEASKKVAFFAIGVEGADMSVLQQISVRQPLRLQGLKFFEMFQWLSSSLTSVSKSTPGDNVPMQSPLGWGSV